MINFYKFIQILESNAAELLAKHRMGIKDHIKTDPQSLRCYICHKKLEKEARYISNISKKRIDTANLVKYAKIKHFLNSAFCSKCIKIAEDYANEFL